MSCKISKTRSGHGIILCGAGHAARWRHQALAVAVAAGALVLGVAAVRTVGSMAFGLLVAPPALHVGAETLNGLAFGRALGSTKGALASGAPACAESGAHCGCGSSMADRRNSERNFPPGRCGRAAPAANGLPGVPGEHVELLGARHACQQPTTQPTWGHAAAGLARGVPRAEIHERVCPASVWCDLGNSECT